MTEEPYKGAWARKALDALAFLAHQAWRPGHPELHYSCGDAEDPEIRRPESSLAVAVNGDMLEVTVDWTEGHPFLSVIFDDNKGPTEFHFWSDDPEDQGDKDLHSWDDLDYAVELVHGWLERHRGPHKYSRTLKQVFGQEPTLRESETQ